MLWSTRAADRLYLCLAQPGSRGGKPRIFAERPLSWQFNLHPVRSRPLPASGAFSDGFSDRVVVNFAEPAEPISPIRWVRGGHVKTFQNLRYTTYARLTAAKTLDDIW